MRPQLLLVDDDSRVRVLLSRVLASAGYDVEEAADGSGALAAATRRPPDVVLTDILMPGTDGLELILELRRLNPRAVILAMSGGTVGSTLHLGSATEFGATQVLEKPFSTDALLTAVADALASSTRSDEPGDARHVPAAASALTPRRTTRPSSRNQRLGR